MASARVKVWDLPVRLFHWVLVLAVAFSWWSGEQGGTALKYHFWSGYCVMGLVLFRVAWGVVGSETARFARFVQGPRAVLAGLRELRERGPATTLGHNAPGGWMIVLLLGALGLQVTTGLFANDDLFNEGPLYPLVARATSNLLTGWHHANFSLLLGLSAVHVLAIVHHRLFKRENLVTPMLTGWRVLPETPARLPEFRGLGRALLCALAAFAIVAGVVSL